MAVHQNSLANLEKGKESQFRAGEEQRKISQAAGVASGESRRARKTIRAELEALLAKHPINDKGQESELSYQSAMIAALLKKALRGDTKAFELIRDTIGEKPAENVMITTNDFSALDKISFEEK